MQVRDSQGIAMELGEVIKSGGEAKIRLVKGQPSLVAKVYHAEKVGKEQRGKLKAMLAKVPTHTALAWPTQLLYQRGRLVGFLMPKIDGYDAIFNFYNPVRRKKQQPGFNWRYLHRTASNLAIIVETVHQAGHLVGDLNESNVLVNDRALVTLVDTDSFQIAGHKGKIYRGVVGKPEYTAPELQGISFQEVNRRPEHDHFALAVLIFQLLMQGYHPFYGVLPDDMSVERSDVMGIKEGLFPYYQDYQHNQKSSIKKPPYGHACPPYAPPFTHLHPHLQALFIRCFVDGHHAPTARPTAGEWQVQLEKAEKALVTCERDHLYSTHLASCPFCPRELAMQKPLPSALEKAMPSSHSVLPQPLSSPALSPATWMQSLRSLLPNGSRSVVKLLWNTILIVTVAITWLRLSSLGMSPQPPAIAQSPAIAQPPASVVVVEAVATYTKTASPQPQASKTALEYTPTREHSASPQPQTSKTVVEYTPTIEHTSAGQGRLADKIACFGTFGFGISCLDQSGWTSFSRDDSSLGGNLILDIAVCPDNKLLIAYSSGISAFDGQAWAEYGIPSDYGLINAIACDANDSIWVTHYEGVSHLDGQSWSTTSSKQLATGEDTNDLIKDVTIAPDGQVWVATAHTIATTSNGNEWTIYQQGQGFDEQYFLHSIAVDHLGEVWVAYSRGVLHFDGSNWVEHQAPDFISPQTLTVDADQNVWLGTLSHGVKRFNGQYWVTYNTQNSELMSNDVQALVIDGLGRVWVGTEWGVSVFDGNEWITYQMDNADLVGNDIRTLAVIGDGPLLPEANDKENGQLSGQLLKPDKKPIANATVELCAPRSSSYFTQSPCEDQPLILQTTTDADGNFLITDIPVGRVALTINVGQNKWIEVEEEHGFDKEHALINAGKETDLSTLIIDW